MRRALVLLAALALPGLASAAGLPARVTIHYELSGGAVSATVTDTLTQGQGQYRIESAAAASGALALLNKGARKRTSSGAVTDRGLAPARFSDERPGKPARVAGFDWGRKVLVLEEGSQREEQPLPADAQDRLSFIYAFAFRAPPSGEFAAAVTDGRGLSDWRYAVVGREKLKTPLGELDTLRLSRRDSADKRTELWLATGRHYLPVRILVTEDGKTLDQVVTRIDTGDGR